MANIPIYVRPPGMLIYSNERRDWGWGVPPGTPEEEYVNKDDLPCENAENQPLCDVLMKKVRSYHVHHVYRARAYRKTAEKVAALTAPASSLTDAEQRLLGVGPKTNKFVYRWIKNPEKCLMLNNLKDDLLWLNVLIRSGTQSTQDTPEVCEKFKRMKTLLTEISQATSRM